MARLRGYDEAWTASQLDRYRALAERNGLSVQPPAAAPVQAASGV
jgi:hypothetical protein